MPDPKKLIEVAMPVKEISEASVYDKYIHHGHISTLHIWWARRPLPVCRAAVFASLVPDPLDENCPKSFKDAVELLLGKNSNTNDNYKPYEDIPYTASNDRMEENSRNRLLMFIGKYSDEFIENEKKGKKTESKNQLSNGSLIKWESRNNDEIISIARKLIWVSHNCQNGKTVKELIDDFHEHYKSIENAEKELYNTINRHVQKKDIIAKEENLKNAIEDFLGKMPKVFDPFAGGGAIPLEAARLGCKTFANDINPVAHIIQKGSIEFPQRYGKPIIYSKDVFVKLYGEEEFNKIDKESLVYSNGNITNVKIENRLAFDVSFYAKKLLKMAEDEIGYLYPANEKGIKPIVYYWSKVGICSNPSCKAEVPLLRQFYLCNKKNKQIYLNPKIKGTRISFEIKKGKSNIEGWNSRGNLKCPCCNNITDVKKIKDQIIHGFAKERLLVVIEENKDGKVYRLPSEVEFNSINIMPDNLEMPNEKMQRNSAGGDTFSWGINQWGQLFSKRQLIVLQTFVNKLQILTQELCANDTDYNKSVITYLAIWIDRIASYFTSFGRWIPQNEQVTSIFGRQAIAMVFDYPEVSILSPSTSGPLNQLEWIILYLYSESKSPFTSICINATSGEKEQFDKKSISAVITDPPYYDAIAYADLSDFFYIWLKRSISKLYPLNFATPQTPKSDECTMLKHHHSGSVEKAKLHFEKKLLNIFDSIEHQTSDMVSIMFAHQSTEAWTTLCNSILGARMNITGSWAIDSERDTRMIANAGSALQSSVTVACRPTERIGNSNFKDIKKSIEKTVLKEVENLYALGFRGADLLTACFGQAVSEFGKYERVEKADGSEVTVAELLEVARESAFNALVKGFPADEFTKFYIGWLQLYSFTESDFDDVNRLVKIGLSIETKELFDQNILIKNGNKQTLASFSERFELNKHLGEQDISNLIDKAHRALQLYKSGNRTALLAYISKYNLSSESTFWRLLNSLVEILPQAGEDYKQVRGLLDNKDSLLREAKASKQPEIEQEKLFS